MKLRLYHIISILFLWLAHSSATAQSVRTYINDIKQLTDSTLHYPIDPSAAENAIEVRISFPMHKESAGKRHNEASIIWGNTDLTSYFSLDITPILNDTGSAFDTPALDVSVTHHTANQVKTLFSQRITDGIASGRSFNSIAVELQQNGETKIYCGDKYLKLIASLQTENPSPGIWGLQAESNTTIEIDDIVIECTPSPTQKTSTSWTPELINHYLADVDQLDSIEGIWIYLDRDTDDRYALLGGRYEVAILKNAHADSYDIIYLSGAEVNASIWQPGMLKGRLISTQFDDHYDLIWLDSKFNEHTTDIHASMSQEAILELNFTTLKSTLRLAKRLNRQQ